MTYIVGCRRCARPLVRSADGLAWHVHAHPAETICTDGEPHEPR